MKLNTKLIYALFLSVFLFTYSCADHTGGGGNNNDPVDPPKSILLSYPELLGMLKHYDKTRKDQFAQALNIQNIQEDTRINFFKLQDLKDYIRYIEEASKEAGVPLDGINFISASYPDDTRSPEAKRNYQTLIMMPATTYNKETMLSFDPFLSSDGVPVLLRDILKKYDPKYNWTYDSVIVPRAVKKSNGFNKSGGGDLSPGGNRSQISPPW